MIINRKDVIWTYLGKFFTVGVNIILLPLVMAALSESELGLWYVFASISQIVSLFDFGFSATISRHMTYAFSGAGKLEKTYVTDSVFNKPNEQLMAEIIVTCRMVYLVISSTGLLVMSTAGTVYIYHVMHDDIQGTFLYAWGLYVISVFLNMFYGYWSALLHGIGAVSEQNRMAVISKVIQLLTAAVLLASGAGLTGFVLSYLVSGVSLRILGKIYFRKKTEVLNLKETVRMSRVRNCFSVIWTTAWRDGLIMLSQYFSTQANTLLCAYYIDLKVTGVYGVVTQLVTVLSSVASAYFSAYQPQYSNACLIRDTAEQKRITCTTDFIYKIIFWSGMAATILFGLPVLRILRPDMEIEIPVLFFTGFFYYLYNQQGLFVSMIASSNRILCCRSYVVTAVCSFCCSLILVRNFQAGIWGIIAAGLITNLLYNNWKWPLFVLRELDISYLDIYREGYKNCSQTLRKITGKYSRTRKN